MYALPRCEAIMYKIKGFLTEKGTGIVTAHAESLKTARAKAKGMREIGLWVEITDAHEMPVPDQEDD